MLQAGFPQLRDIRAALEIPLVLHCGSGISDDDFRRAVENGIGREVQTAIKNVVAHHMQVFGSAGKA